MRACTACFCHWRWVADAPPLDGAFLTRSVGLAVPAGERGLPAAAVS